MFGAIVGDIVGSVYEWHNIKTKERVQTALAVIHSFHRIKKRLSAEHSNLLKAFVLSHFLHFRVQDIVSKFGGGFQISYQKSSPDELYESRVSGIPLLLQKIYLNLS